MSAQDQTPDPPLVLKESIIPTTDPYVPATIKNVPQTTTKTFQHTPRVHLCDRCSLPLFQLSYNHMQPLGWKLCSVPSKAPIKEMRLSKLGMALAIMYATTATPRTQPIQVPQCTSVFATRCFDPRSIRTKKCLLASYAYVNYRSL